MDQISIVNGIHVIQPPKPAWKCQLLPGYELHVEEGKQPNKFHRWMQKLCFGFKWVELEYEQFE